MLRPSENILTGPSMKTVSLIIKVIILLIFLVLAVINRQVVQFNYLPEQSVNAPLIVLLFGMFVIGALFGIFALFGRLLRLRAENSRLRAEVKKAARLNNTDIAAPTAAPVPAPTHAPVPAAETAKKE